ncbi:TPA: hypothetical protein VEO38_003050 [Providencia alcalifaciens]|nr:hypothetical protein [Providencia alcalifaciens]
MAISSNSLPSSRTTVLDSTQDVKKNTHRSRLIDSISRIISTITSCFKKQNSSSAGFEKSKFYISLSDHGKDDLLEANYLLRMNISNLQEEISLYDKEIYSEGNKKNLFPIPQKHDHLKSRIKNSLAIKDIHKQNVEFEDIMKVQCQVISDSINKLNAIKSTEAKIFGRKPINTSEFIQYTKNNISKSQQRLGKTSLTDELNSKVKSVPDSHQNDEFEFDEVLEWNYELNELPLMVQRNLTSTPNTLSMTTPFLIEGNLDNQSIINHIEFAEIVNKWDKDFYPSNDNCKTHRDESENEKIITELKNRLKLQQELTEKLQNDKDALQDKLNEDKEGLKLLKKIITADTKIIKSAQMQEKIISKSHESIDDLTEIKENRSEIMSSEKSEPKKIDSSVNLKKSKRKCTVFNHSENVERLHRGIPTVNISRIQRSPN